MTQRPAVMVEKRSLTRHKDAERPPDPHQLALQRQDSDTSIQSIDSQDTTVCASTRASCQIKSHFSLFSSALWDYTDVARVPTQMFQLLQPAWHLASILQANLYVLRSNQTDVAAFTFACKAKYWQQLGMKRLLCNQV